MEFEKKKKFLYMTIVKPKSRFYYHYQLKKKPFSGVPAGCQMQFIEYGPCLN